MRPGLFALMQVAPVALWARIELALAALVTWAKRVTWPCKAGFEAYNPYNFPVNKMHMTQVFLANQTVTCIAVNEDNNHQANLILILFRQISPLQPVHLPSVTQFYHVRTDVPPMCVQTLQFARGRPWKALCRHSVPNPTD